MKLYHIDRLGHLKAGETISLITSFTNDKMKEKGYYKKGLSSHGIHYFTCDDTSHSYFLDVVFEYERLINYPDKLSRYQSLFCFDEYGVIDFIETKHLEDNFYKIYEIEVAEKDFERHDMSLIRGWSHQSAIKYAKAYWEDKPDPFDKENKIVYEYLVKLPIKVGKEAKLSEIKKRIKEKKDK